jgi:peptide/nickel transport system permease protein
MKPGGKMVVGGSLLLLLFVAMAIFAPLVTHFSPYEQELYDTLAPPGADHFLGQDRLGRDIYSRIVYGGRISLAVGFITVFISSIVGTLVGAFAGYAGGKIDEVTMRIVDIFLAFPGILLAIAIMAVTGPGFGNVLLALSLMGWTGFARLVRGQVISLKEREYVIAAKSIGAGDMRIVLRHLLPNLVAPLTVEATFAVASAILAEAGLGFLGLGVQPPTPSWGTMLSEGREFLLVAPHLTTYPGLAIMFTVLAVNFLGDGLRDMFDPKSGGSFRA